MEPQFSEVAELNDLEKSIEALFERAGAESGLADSTFDILYALAVYGDGRSQRELCDCCWMGKQTVHSAVGRLARQGILSIEPGRGRTTRVVLTEEGRNLIKERIRPIAEAEARALSSLPPEERDALKDALERYRDALAKELEEIGGHPCP